MYCPQCGYENPEDAKFCIGCRYDYSQSVTLTPPVATEPEEIGTHSVSQKWKCALCGELVDDDFDACWNCQAGKPANSEVVMAPRDDLQQQLHDEREAREERIRKMQGPSANPLSGCLWDVLAIFVCMILMVIAVSMGYPVLGYVILYGAGGVFLAFATKNFWAMPKHQKVLSLAAMVGVFSLFFLTYAIFDPVAAVIPFLGFGLTAFLWWLGVKMAREQKKDQDA